jgi:REP element-mobilizing transposase RayT
MPRFRKNAPATKEIFNGKHRFEHWYRDNSVYFITARCRDRYPAFESEEAKAIFWDRFNHYANLYGFVTFVITLLNNHYHVLGYLRNGNNLGPMMQRIHGSVAKLTNDLLPQRIKPFWRDSVHHDYFDGCIRDVLQCRRAYRYTLLQSVRHLICSDYRDYSHTHVAVELEAAVRRSVELKAFMDGVPYTRYDRDRSRTGRPA